MKYIDADRLKAEIERRMTENCELAEKAGVTFGQRAVEDNDILALIDSLQQDETQVDKMLCSQVWWEEQGWIMIPPDATIEGIDSLLRQVKKKLQQEQPEGLHFTPLNRLIQKIPSKNWNDTVNNYARKLRDCLIKEGYRKDAEVLQSYISYMNGNNVPMATMDEQEQPEISNNLVDIDAVREDFITEVYRVLDADPTNDRANAIIDAFDSLPTVSQEQPDVDLEKEINRFWDSCTKHKNERGGNVIWSNKLEVEVLARHFFDMGRNARKL